MTPLKARGDAARARSQSALAFVQAAERLAAEGAAYADLSVGEIARRAGYSRASFYAHFPDKLALATAVGQRLSEALEGVASPWLAGADDRPVGEILDSVAATFDAHRGAVLLITEASAYDPDIRALHASLVTRFAQAVAQRLRSGPHGAGAHRDADASAFVLVWSTQAVLAELLRRTAEPPDPSTIAALTAQWEAALQHHQSSRAGGS